MREQMRKVIYLMEVPFTARDFVRLGADLYQKAGLEVEVFDLHTLFHPECAAPSSVGGFEGVRVFSELGAALAALNALGPETMLINLLAHKAATLPVAKKLRSCKALCVEVRTNAVPRAGGSGFRQRLARFSPRKLVDFFVRILLWSWVARRPDIIIYGGEVMRPAPHEAAKFVSAHALDYDLFLEQEDLQPEESYVVFVDQYLPFHPDFSTLKSKCPVTPELYYPALNAFFELLEARMGMPVVVAAHPMAAYEENVRYFGNRRVVSGRTLELIRHASLVLLHYSTALNFAVLANIPMLFLTTDELERAMGPTMTSMASMVGRSVLNVDKLPENWDEGLLDVDAKAYSTYSRRYIKEPRTPDKPFWQILLDAANGTRGGVMRPSGMRP